MMKSKASSPRAGTRATAKAVQSVRPVVQAAAKGVAAPKAKKAKTIGQLSLPQVKDLRVRLLSLKDELALAIEAKASFVVNAHGTESVIKGDEAEVAEKQRASNAMLQELDMVKNRLQMVMRALRKIESGTYGYCEETEEPIGYERLQAVPWARFSVQIQERRESKMREFRMSRLRAEM